MTETGNRTKLTVLVATYATLIASVGVVGLGFFTFFYMVQNATTVEKAKAAETSMSNFVVVGQYKGCDVVRWHDNMLADYRYFLHCENQPKWYP